MCRTHQRRLLLPLLAALLTGLGACRRIEAPPAVAQTIVADATGLFEAVPVGGMLTKNPWIAHVLPVDLDGDGKLDLVACEAQENKIIWLRQVEPGRFEETVLADGLTAPVHVEASDLDGDADLDLLVSTMGYVFPNNDKIGSVVVLENDGRQTFTQRVVLEQVARVCDVRAADLNADGKLDLVVAHFGYDQGEVRWLERVGPWEFRSHVLLELSGAINVGCADFTGDGLVDIVVQISQQWEEVYLFENQRNGIFQRKRLWGSTNEDFGSSGLTVADLNRDGRPDVLFSNGDGFGPAAVPGPRPWHGVQWLENRGNGYFAYHRIGHLDGAYSPISVDLDGDGAMDVVASSAFIEKDAQGRALPSLMWFRNDGQMRFEPRVLTYSPQHQIAVAAGDFDGNGRTSLVTGGFYVFPTDGAIGRLTMWRPTAR